MRRATALALLVGAFLGSAAAARADLPPCEAAPCASDVKPAAILSYYRGRDETNLIRATLRADLPADTPVYIGYYWGTLPHPVKLPPAPRPPPGPKPELPNRRFAPIFSLSYTEFFTGRELDADARRTMRAAGEPSGYGGHIPSTERLVKLRSGTALYRWGLELGRRYRDRIRIKRAKGLSITTWQFDELRNEIAGAGGYRLRQLSAGVLRGLTYGRAPLGDTKLPGIVFATQPALRLAGAGGDAALESFWATVDDCTLYFVGEEYPEFTGSASAAARRYAHSAAGLAGGGAAERSLATKYVVGLTPGAKLLPGLGGNVHHRSRAATQRWRLAFARARAASGPAGFAQYNFTFENATVPVMNDALAALARGLAVGG